MKRRTWMILLVIIPCLLCGCHIRTVEQMYCLPKRSEAQQDLQAAIDLAAQNMEYCAPTAGSNRQTVQMVDLNGDGQQEYLLFAKDDTETPLKILIFAKNGNEFILMDTLAGNGTRFDQVQYVQMDDGGVEIVVGRQLSDQVPGSLSVYSWSANGMHQILSTNYAEFVTCDLDKNGAYEIFVLRPGLSDSDSGVAELYSMAQGVMEKSNEAPMSGPTDRLKRIITGKLHDGQNAVFVGTTVDESAIITDVYTLVNDRFTNVSLSNESGTSVQTLRNYYIYASDMDEDGAVELPDLITMTPLPGQESLQEQYIIRWYAMTAQGTEVDKMFTYHNYMGGWYLELDPRWASQISVSHENDAYAFYLWDSQWEAAEKIFTVYSLRGQDRESQAIEDNRFVLHRSETAVFAARLEVASGALEITREDLIVSFGLIHQDWNTGEM